MNEVKRYGIHFAVAHMMKEDSTGCYVLASDYAALEAELKTVKADRSACWAEFKVMTKSCLDAERERDAALAECERLRGALNRARKAESRPEFVQIIDAALSAKP